MRLYCLATLLVGVAMSTPVPQGFDWNAIQDPSLSSVPEASVPVVVSERELEHGGNLA